MKMNVGHLKHYFPTHGLPYAMGCEAAFRAVITSVKSQRWATGSAGQVSPDVVELAGLIQEAHTLVVPHWGIPTDGLPLRSRAMPIENEINVAAMNREGERTLTMDSNYA
jgi:hypothetical protein